MRLPHHSGSAGHRQLPAFRRWAWAAALAAVSWFPAATTVAQPVETASTWKALADDDIHDPESPAVELKQDPAAALSLLPPDNPKVGNQVRWVRALQQGLIEPRAKLYPSTEVRLLDLDILFPETSAMPFVLFPHRRHTEWLDCENCHNPELFREEAGATPINMFTVLMGEHCGRCHGAVAFPLTECNRCHSVPQDFSLLRRGREFTASNLSPFQDSEKIVVGWPKSMWDPKR